MTKCWYCETAEATALKDEVELELTDAEDVKHIHTRPICDGCETAWFDGTEDHPGTRPLS